jgi:hypothetical protein
MASKPVLKQQCMQDMLWQRAKRTAVDPAVLDTKWSRWQRRCPANPLKVGERARSGLIDRGCGEGATDAPVARASGRKHWLRSPPQPVTN